MDPGKGTGTMTRARALSILTAFLAATAVLFAAVLPAMAKAPDKKFTQVPGYYRMLLGDFEITAILDGTLKLPVSLLKGATPKEMDKLFEAMFVDCSTGVQTAVNAYLVNTGGHLILVDTGMGKAGGPTMGFLAENIRASGYDPAQVDTVLLTHMHPDHVNGLVTADGKAAFPNATVRSSKAEADHWLSEAEEAKAPEGKKRLYKAARAALAPYLAAGTFKTIEDGGPLPESVDVLMTPGHTPGHCGYMFTSKGQRFLAFGDIIHSHSIQFAKPGVAIEFDSDQKMAVAARKKLLKDAAREGYWIAGAHLPFPGIGHVRAHGKGYVWVPVEFAPVEKGKQEGY